MLESICEASTSGLEEVVFVLQAMHTIKNKHQVREAVTIKKFKAM